MKRITVFTFLGLLALAVLSGCVARVGYQPPPPQPVYVVASPQPAPVAAVAVEAPPPIEIAEPELVVVPSGNAYVYMVPNVAGVYFYGGGWYRYYGGGWYSATVWGGPWVSIAAAPGVVIGIDPFYTFYLPAGYFRIGWGDFHSHWRSWDSGRHWHNHPHFRNEMRRDVRQTRMNQINADRRTGKISRFDQGGKVAGPRGQQFRQQQGPRGPQGINQQQRTGIKPQQGIQQQKPGMPHQQGGPVKQAPVQQKHSPREGQHGPQGGFQGQR